MKKFLQILKNDSLKKISCFVLSLLALIYCFYQIKLSSFLATLASIEVLWFIPILLVNFFVIALKTLRWQILVAPTKKVGFAGLYRLLIITFMLNNLLPAKLGEVARVHYLEKDAHINRLTSTATVVASYLLEFLSFVIFALIFIHLVAVPGWVYRGIVVSSVLTLGLYFFLLVASKKVVRRPFLISFQEGLKGLLSTRTTGLALIVSFLSWFFQGVLLLMVHQSFGVNLPLVSLVMVLVAVNIIMAIPAAPGHMGTFEFICVLTYQFLGLSASAALALGVTYHLVQAIPVVLVGGVLLHWKPRMTSPAPAKTEAGDVPY